MFSLKPIFLELVYLLKKGYGSIMAEVLVVRMLDNFDVELFLYLLRLAFDLLRSSDT